MSPLAIKMLIHFHLASEPYELNLPIHQDIIATFLRMGAIEPSAIYDDVYHTTDRGTAWVKAICQVPVPKQVFIDEQGRPL